MMEIQAQDYPGTGKPHNLRINNLQGSNKYGSRNTTLADRGGTG